jgi:hypothetical protein
MTDTREDVLAVAIKMYGQGNLDKVLAILDEYGSKHYEPEMNRVHLAILQLSEGKKEKLRYFVNTAKVDYRDVLAFQQLGPLSSKEGEKWHAMVKSLIDRWSKK